MQTTNAFMTKGDQFATEAVKADHEKRLVDAVKNYRLAVEYLETGLKYELSAGGESELALRVAPKIEVYRHRADVLDKHIESLRKQNLFGGSLSGRGEEISSTNDEKPIDNDGEPAAGDDAAAVASIFPVVPKDDEREREDHGKTGKPKKKKKDVSDGSSKSLGASPKAGNKKEKKKKKSGKSTTDDDEIVESTTTAAGGHGAAHDASSAAVDANDENVDVADFKASAAPGNLVDEAMPSAYTFALLLRNWLLANFEPCPGFAIPVSSMHEAYVTHCQQSDARPLGLSALKSTCRQTFDGIRFSNKSEAGPCIVHLGLSPPSKLSLPVLLWQQQQQQQQELNASEPSESLQQQKEQKSVHNDLETEDASDENEKLVSEYANTLGLPAKALPFLSRGADLAKAATELDKQRDPKAAHQYELASAFFARGLKYETNQQTVVAVQEKINEYISRANQLNLNQKQQQQQQQQQKKLINKKEMATPTPTTETTTNTTMNNDKALEKENTPMEQHLTATQPRPHKHDFSKFQSSSSSSPAVAQQTSLGFLESCWKDSDWWSPDWQCGRGLIEFSDPDTGPVLETQLVGGTGTVVLIGPHDFIRAQYRGPVRCSVRGLSMCVCRVIELRRCPVAAGGWQLLVAGQRFPNGMPVFDIHVVDEASAAAVWDAGPPPRHNRHAAVQWTAGSLFALDQLTGPRAPAVNDDDERGPAAVPANVVVQSIVDLVNPGQLHAAAHTAGAGVADSVASQEAEGMAVGDQQPVQLRQWTAKLNYLEAYADVLLSSVCDLYSWIVQAGGSAACKPQDLATISTLITERLVECDSVQGTQFRVQRKRVVRTFHAADTVIDQAQTLLRQPDAAAAAAAAAGGRRFFDNAAGPFRQAIDERIRFDVASDESPGSPPPPDADREEPFYFRQLTVDQVTVTFSQNPPIVLSLQ